VGETGPVAKAVLILLLMFSLVSWAIILFQVERAAQGRECKSGPLLCRAFSARLSACRMWEPWLSSFAPAHWWEYSRAGFEEYRPSGWSDGWRHQKPISRAARHAESLTSEELSRFEPQSFRGCGDYRRGHGRSSACLEPVLGHYRCLPTDLGTGRRRDFCALWRQESSEGV